MAIDFPDNPPDGDKFTYDDGQGRIVTYTYSAADDSWTGPINKFTVYAQPTVDQVTLTPPAVSGTGTEADPYILKPTTIQIAGRRVFSAHKITVSGQTIDRAVAISNNVQNSGPRFNQPLGVINSNGQYITHLEYSDQPRSNVDGIKYQGNFKLGSVHFKWLVTQMSPHLPVKATYSTPAAPAEPKPLPLVSPTPTPTVSTTTPTPTPYVAVPFNNIFNVTVKLKTGANHTYGTGSLKAYYLAGVEAYTLAFTKGTTYRFNQSDTTNAGHPLRLYTDAAKTTEYTSGVVTNGTPGEVGAGTTITVPSDAPAKLYYQCSNHGYMGGEITIA